MLMINSLVCLQETWALNQNQIDDCIITTDKNIYRRNYYDGTNNNKFEFSSLLIQLTEKIYEFKSKGYEILILGDFNTDPIKDNFNTHELINFMKRHSLRMIDVEETQIVTFSKHNLNTKSWIDHVLVDKNNRNVRKCQICVSPENKSDQNPIIIEYELEKLPIMLEIGNKRLANLDWTNLLTLLAYQERVRKGLCKLEILKLEIETESDARRLKINLTKLLNEISSVLLNAVQKTSNELECAKRYKGTL
ncbi:unnamed protein product [Brachionus calyciflorus]|uniref:Endonuclease/exonuclease/phosphatase domain-containing protein n=1 Tax=Brachionus calyciflorus TaxID=104777 RepID=A0A814SB40_9BILA|nr:unnamed protein product [Brachionus calyciflorus]